MASTMRRLAPRVFIALIALAAASSALAAPIVPIVWMVSPVTGDIVLVNPRTGAVIRSFAPPLRPLPGDTRLGLTMAEGGRTLLYQLGNPMPDWSYDPERSTLFRLDPFTGAIRSREPGFGYYWGTDGLSWQRRGSRTYTYFSHANPIPDIHRIENLGERDEEDLPFFGPLWDFYYIVGGLGGDGYGREFGVFIASDDPDEQRVIIEYDPFDVYGSWSTPWPAPTNDIEGLAFDGRYLYASSASGRLFTLNPDTGRVIREVTLPDGFGPQDGYMFDIAAAAVPEPGPLVLLMIAALGLSVMRRATRSARQ